MMLAHKSRWHCMDCTWRYVRRVRRLIHRGLADGVKYVVLTAPGEGLDVEAWNAGARGRFKAFLRLLRQETGQRCPYFATWELQRRGALHVNVLLRVRYLPHRQLQSLAVRTGFGARASIRQASKEDVRYVAKIGPGGLVGYVTKDVSERHLMGHAYSYSRSWLLVAGPGVAAKRPGVWKYGRSYLQVRTAMESAGYLTPAAWSAQGRAPPGMGEPDEQEAGS